MHKATFNVVLIAVLLTQIIAKESNKQELYIKKPCPGNICEGGCCKQVGYICCENNLFCAEDVKFCVDYSSGRKFSINILFVQISAIQVAVRQLITQFFWLSNFWTKASQDWKCTWNALGIVSRKYFNRDLINRQLIIFQLDNICYSFEPRNLILQLEILSI